MHPLLSIDHRTDNMLFSNYIYICTVKRFGLLQPYFGHLSCTPFVHSYNYIHYTKSLSATSIDFHYQLYASMEGEPWILYDVQHKFLQKDCSCSWLREHIFIQKNSIVNSSDSSPWMDKAPIFSCLRMHHHWCPTNLKYLPAATVHAQIITLWSSVQL